MNEKEFDDFLERGWEYGADLFFEGKVYHIQCDFLGEEEGFNLAIFSFKAKNNGDGTFSAFVNEDNTYVDYEVIVDENFAKKDDAKKKSFSDKFFGGNSFWQVNTMIEWLDEGSPITKRE
ncbi:MAG: hypothetical protein K6B51_02550 [Bacilli bacterium]|nr:hypothetical protein [Bacilli bacterium]